MSFQSAGVQKDPNWQNTWPVVRHAPAGGRRARLMMLSSGKSRDMTGAEPDAALLRATAEALTPHGVECINPRLPLREDGLSETDEALIALRAEMAAYALQQDTACETVVMAVSLGTLSALNLAARRETARLIDALVLVGCILERPVAPVGRIGSVDLVYGGRNHVGYLRTGDDKIRDIEGPRDYGRRTCRHLVTGPGVQIAMHVLPGAGHALERVDDGGPEHSAAMALLTPLLLDRLGLVTTPDPATEDI